MSTTLWTKCHYAKCFGHWVVSDPECVRCAVTDHCERRTKVKTEEVEVLPEPESGEIEDQKVISPLDYMLQSLTGKFDHEVEEKEKAVLHKFRKDGKTVIAVAIGDLGKIKIVSIPKNISRIFGSLGSIEEVESILTEML